ncbi:MAG: YqjD family protein [Steroidobacteraceae bacterium]
MRRRRVHVQCELVRRRQGQARKGGIRLSKETVGNGIASSTCSAWRNFPCRSVPLAVCRGFPAISRYRRHEQNDIEKWKQPGDRWFVRHVNADRLVRDLNALATDVDKLVEASADNANEAVADARERIESLESARLCAIEEAKSIAQSTDDYLRDNVWTAVGLAGAVGFLMGTMVGHRSARSRRGRE